MKKNGLIRKLRLISKFMTTQSGEKLITIPIPYCENLNKCPASLKHPHLISVRGKFPKWNKRPLLSSTSFQ